MESTEGWEGGKGGGVEGVRWRVRMGGGGELEG